jgi:putative NADH-flavin reductase
MKTIALIGATGKVGQQFLNAALAAGYKVKALARNSSKISQKSEKLEIIVGDVLNQADVDKVVAGSDIVVSLFGQVKDSPEWVQRDGTKKLLLAMQKNNIDRIISLSGGGLPFPEKDEPKFADKLIRTIMKIAVPKVLNDANAHAEVLKSSKAKWTIVRGPRLTDKPRVGKYRIGWVGVNGSTSISRADLADFILSQVEDETFNFMMPFVSN